MRLVLLLGEANKVLDRARYEGLFDAVLVSNLAGSQADAFLNKVVQPSDSAHAVVTVETAKYALDFKPEHKTEFVRRVYEAGREAGWQLSGAAPVEGQAEPHLHFVCCGDSGDEWLPIPEMEAPVQVQEQEKAEGEGSEGADEREHRIFKCE